MNIALVGAGVIGIATAYELAQDGHTVTVYDKSATACEEASFAISGLIAPSLCLPFASVSEKSGAVLRFLDTGRRLSQSPWRSLKNAQSLWHWTQSQSSELRAIQQTQGRALGCYSATRLRHIADHLQMELECSEGQLLLVRTEQALQRLKISLETLKTQDIPFRLLTPAEARQHEPSLHGEAALYAAVLLPDDRITNCRQFALELKAETQRIGVTYQFGADILDISFSPRPTLTIAQGDGVHTASTDHVVLCTGHLPTALRSKVAPQLPMFELHGYALSVAIREPLNAPRSAVQDWQEQTVINRLGNRIRVSAGAELGIKPSGNNQRVVSSMYRLLEQYFPGAANYPAGTQVWHGTRHFLKDGLPVIGPSGTPHLSLNLGHGACGWTWACGSARLLADQVAEQNPVIPAMGFSPIRFAH